MQTRGVHVFIFPLGRSELEHLLGTLQEEHALKEQLLESDLADKTAALADMQALVEEATGAGLDNGPGTTPPVDAADDLRDDIAALETMLEDLRTEQQVQSAAHVREITELRAALAAAEEHLGAAPVPPSRTSLIPVRGASPVGVDRGKTMAGVVHGRALEARVAELQEQLDEAVAMAHESDQDLQAQEQENAQLRAALARAHSSNAPHDADAAGSGHAAGSTRNAFEESNDDVCDGAQYGLPAGVSVRAATVTRPPSGHLGLVLATNGSHVVIDQLQRGGMSCVPTRVCVCMHA